MFRISIIAGCIAASCTTAQAQTVQLPTFNSFGVRTTVVVPDRGGASLGGGSSGAGQFRRPGFLLPTARGLGAARRAAGVAARVFVIDNAEIDRQIRGINAQQQPVAPPAKLRPAPLAVDRIELGKKYVRKARAEAEAGRHAAARKYYQMGIRRLPDELARYATAEMQRMQRSTVAHGPLAAQPSELD